MGKIIINYWRFVSLKAIIKLVINSVYYTCINYDYFMGITYKIRCSLIHINNNIYYKLTIIWLYDNIYKKWLN